MSPTEIHIVRAITLGDIFAFEQRDLAEAVAQAVGADRPITVELLDDAAGRALVQEHFEAFDGYPPGV